MQTIKLYSIALTSAALLYCGYSEFDAPTVPATLTAPPVGEKYMAVTGVLEALNHVVRKCINATGDTQASGTKNCSDGASGTADLTGAISYVAGGKVKSFDGDENTKNKELFLSKATLSSWVYSQAVRGRKDWSPGMCTISATVNGSSELYIRKTEVIPAVTDTSGAWDNIDFGTRGLYKNGTYTITFKSPTTLQNVTYTIGFTEKVGMIYDKTGGAFTNGTSTDLFFNSSYSGEITINGQKYSYQDIFVNTLTASALSSATCEKTDPAYIAP